VASGVGKLLYADKVTEERRRLGYARVLVEIDIDSECPKEIFLWRQNGDPIGIGVEYPWLPPKCSICAGFGHAAYACSKKEKKVWRPKAPVQKKLGTVSLANKFDKTISKPLRTTEKKSNNGVLRLSNSFEAIGRLDMEDIDHDLPPPFLKFLKRLCPLNLKEKPKCVIMWSVW
jgi:hypothetical protein